MAAMMSRGMLLPSLTSRVNPMPKKNKDPAAVRILPCNEEAAWLLRGAALSVLNGPAVWDGTSLEPARSRRLLPALPATGHRRAVLFDINGCSFVADLAIHG